MGRSFTATMSRSPSPTSEAEPSAGKGTADDLPKLLESLQEDRLWLLRQLDSGRWPEWRLDLAALERELGQLLDQATERIE